MDHTVTTELRSIYKISDHHIQETTGVEHRTERANYIDFHSAQGEGFKKKKKETVGKNKSLA